MKIHVVKENGYLPKKYSKYAEEKDRRNGNPIVSFPIELTEVPEKAKTYALTLIDFDAVPVCGFPWIHWIACNVPSISKKIPENISAGNMPGIGIIQGQNSFASPFVGETDTAIIHRYAGPTPPDRDHNYQLRIYALDTELELQEGFCLNELYDKMNSHIIDEACENILAQC